MAKIGIGYTFAYMIVKYIALHRTPVHPHPTLWSPFSPPFKSPTENRRRPSVLLSLGRRWGEGCCGKAQLWSPGHHNAGIPNGNVLVATGFPSSWLCSTCLSTSSPRSRKMGTQQVRRSLQLIAGGIRCPSTFFSY